MMTMVMMMMMVMRGHRGPSNYICCKYDDNDDHNNDDDDDDGHEGTSGAVKLYLQQMSQLLLLTVIWLSLHLTNYLARQTFVFDEISFLHFCICILVYVFFILLYLYLTKYHFCTFVPAAPK